MRAKAVVGKRLVKVNQTRAYTDSDVAYNVDNLVFEDGTVLYFTVAETETEYIIEGGVVKKEKLK